MQVYLDAAPVIYLIENVPPFAGIVQARLRQPDVVLVASHLTRMECRVKPVRDENTLLLAKFDRFFNSAVSELVPLSREAMERATALRARLGFRTPDAIHLAAALVSGCDVFLTNDHRLDRAVGITVEVIEVAPSNS